MYSNKCSEGLAFYHSMCNLHVTSLSKITPRYFALFTNGMFLPFKVRWDTDGRRLQEEEIPRVLSSLFFISQRSHQVFIEVRPRWSFLTTKPTLRSVTYRQVSSVKRARWTLYTWGASFMYIFKRVGDNRSSWHTCLHFLWRRYFAFHRNSEFSLWKKRANDLDQTGRTFQYWQLI
jgi:hypothetical protein